MSDASIDDVQQDRSKFMAMSESSKRLKEIPAVSGSPISLALQNCLCTTAPRPIDAETCVQDDLIYDIGMHRGEDTEYYLKNGFRVVAVEANRELCKEVAARFPAEIGDSRLTIVNAAIAEKPGAVTFYRNEKLSSWGTTDPAWAQRNAAHGAPSSEIIVDATTISDIIRRFGIPYYAKIDIEGADLLALRGFHAARARPAFVSIEASKTSFAALRSEFYELQRLGFTRFKVIAQHKVHRQRLAGHRFRGGSSGAFGPHLTGRWLTAGQALRLYRLIMLRHRLIGDKPVIRNKWIRCILRLLIGKPGWYDTHAMREQ